MGDKFLGSGGANINISNGTAPIFGASIGAINLDPSQPLKTNSVRQLVSSKLDIDDINNLQNELNNAITDPITLKEKVQPANPAVNTKIIYASSADNEIHLLDEFGVDKIFSTSTTPFLPLGGGTMTGNLDMGNQQILNTSITGGLGLEVQNNKDNIIILQSDLGTETTNRTNADTNLQNQITTNDTDILNLQTDLGTETTNRTNADTNLQNQITTNDTDILNLQNGKVNKGGEPTGILSIGTQALNTSGIEISENGAPILQCGTTTGGDIEIRRTLKFTPFPTGTTQFYSFASDVAAGDSALQTQITNNFNQINTNLGDISNLQTDLGNEITNRTNADTNLQNQIDEVKQNPTENTDILTSYPVQWSSVRSGDLTVNNTTGVVNKPTPNTQVSWAYSEQDMLEPHKYNYQVKVSIYSVVASQAYIHFCSKNKPATDRTGTTYPAEIGTTGTFPTPEGTNIWGRGASFRLSTAFYQYINESSVLNFPNPADNIDTTGATQAIPWEFTFVISEGKITQILVEHSTDPVFDALPRFGVSEFEIPQEGLFVGLSDINNFTPASSFEIGVSIESRTIRTDNNSPYNLKNQLSQNLTVSLSGEGERFIPALVNMAKLQGYTSTGVLISNSYFLPYPDEENQRLIIINESGQDLTLYDIDNSLILNLPAGQDIEFISKDLVWQFYNKWNYYKQNIASTQSTITPNTNNIYEIKGASDFTISNPKYIGQKLTIFNNQNEEQYQTLQGTDIGNGNVLKMISDGVGNIYLAGSFTLVNGATVNRIAKYNSESGQYSACDGGIDDGQVNDMVLVGNLIILVGTFTAYNGGSSIAKGGRILRYDIVSNTFSEAVGGLDNEGKVVIADPILKYVYIGGLFTNVNNSQTANRVVAYNYSNDSYISLPNDVGVGINSGSVQGLEITPDGKFIYLTGSISAAGNYTGLGNICRYDTATDIWSSIGTLNQQGNHLKLYENYLYLASEALTQITQLDSTIKNINEFGRYNTKNRQWSAVVENDLDGEVNVIEILPNGEVLVGGLMTNHFYHMSKFGKKLIGSGMIFSDQVYSFVYDDYSGYLYVGGNFTQSNNSLALNRIMKTPICPMIKYNQDVEERLILGDKIEVQARDLNYWI